MYIITKPKSNKNCLWQVFGKNEKQESPSHESPSRQPQTGPYNDVPVDDEGTGQGKAREASSPTELKQQLEQLQALASTVQDKNLRKNLSPCV